MRRLLYGSLCGVAFVLAAALFIYVFGYQVLLCELLTIVCGIPFLAWSERHPLKTQTKTLSFSNEQWRKVEARKDKSPPVR